jgi:hypothetical protein
MQGKGKGPMDLISLDRVPMIDIDTPNPLHFTQKGVTAENLGEALDNLMRYLRGSGKRAGAGGRVFLTPGGVRYWEEGVQATPQQFNWMSRKAKGDPFYRHFSEAPRSGLLIPTPVARAARYDPQKTLELMQGQPKRRVSIPPGFASRVGPKAQRGGEDWVAKEILSMGSGQVNPQSRALLRHLHDRPIAAARTKRSEEAFLRKLAQELPSVEPPVARRILEGLGLSFIGAAGLGHAAPGSEA